MNDINEYMSVCIQYFTFDTMGIKDHAYWSFLIDESYLVYNWYIYNNCWLVMFDLKVKLSTQSDYKQFDIY